EMGGGETRQGDLRAEARRVDDDRAARGGEMARSAAGLLGGIHDHRHATQGALALGEARDRALRISIDDGRTTSLEVPMDGEAARHRALAAATFHGGHRDDRARHPMVSRYGSKRRINAIQMLSFSP